MAAHFLPPMATAGRVGSRVPHGSNVSSHRFFFVCSASRGLGFYHVNVSEEGPSQWLNLTNCGVVRVISGQITANELEKELAEIFYKEWPWQIRELETGQFLVRFPPHKRVADIKNHPSFGLRKQGVHVEVLEWVGETMHFEELQDV